MSPLTPKDLSVYHPSCQSLYKVNESHGSFASFPSAMATARSSLARRYGSRGTLALLLVGNNCYQGSHFKSTGTAKLILNHVLFSFDNYYILQGREARPGGCAGRKPCERMIRSGDVDQTHRKVRPERSAVNLTLEDLKPARSEFPKRERDDTPFRSRLEVHDLGWLEPAKVNSSKGRLIPERLPRPPADT